MIALLPGVRVYLACGITDMRKGMVGLAMLVQQNLADDPLSGALYAFRGRRAGLIKLLWHDGIGLCMLTKKLEHGQFVWPSTSTTGRIALSAAQLAALLDGCEWRAPPPRRMPELMGLITPESLVPIRRRWPAGNRARVAAVTGFNRGRTSGAGDGGSTLHCRRAVAPSSSDN